MVIPQYSDVVSRNIKTMTDYNSRKQSEAEERARAEREMAADVAWIKDKQEAFERQLAEERTVEDRVEELRRYQAERALSNKQQIQQLAEERRSWPEQAGDKDDDIQAPVRLRFGDWSMTNPNYEPLHKALWIARYSLKNLTQTQAYLLCAAVEDYLHLVAHPATTKSIIEQLKKIRTAVQGKGGKHESM